MDKLHYSLIAIIAILTLIVIVIVYFISLFVSSTKQNCSDYQLYNKILLNDVKHDIKPGDLLLFSSNKYNIITRTFGHGTFSHIAIVTRINGKLYTLEMVQNDYVYPGNIREKGIIAVPIEERILYYNGDVYIASLNHELCDKQVDIINLHKDKNYKFIKKWTALMTFKTKNKLFGNERFCSEYIAEILNGVGISSIPINSEKTKLQSAIVDLCNGDIYKKPVQIIHEGRFINSILDDYKTLSYC